jgi:hypothetical protein
LPGQLAGHAHDLGGGITERGALEVELDTAGHAFDIFFEETGAGALLTNGSAGAAGFYTFLVLCG